MHHLVNRTLESLSRAGMQLDLVRYLDWLGFHGLNIAWQGRIRT